MNFHQLLLLLKVKFKILLNGFLKGELKKRIRKLFALVGGAVLFIFLYIWIYEILSVLSKSTAVNFALTENILIVAFLGFFIFLLASGITISIHYLFISSDLPLLMSSPVAQNTIFTFKLLEAIFANSTFFFFLGMPFFIAYGIVAQAAWFYYPVMILSAFCFLSVPISISFLGALLIVKVIPASRARELMAILLAIVSFGIWMALQVVRASQFDQSSSEFDPQTFEKLGQISHSIFLNYLPSTWAARSLSGIASDNFAFFAANFFPLILLTAVLFYLAMKLSTAAFDKGLISNKQSITIRKRKKREADDSLSFSNTGNSIIGTITSIFKRDLKLFTRDSRQITNQIMFVAMMIFLPLIQNDPQSESTFSAYRPYIFVVMLSGFLAAQISSRLIPIETKSFWITKLIPQSGLKIIWAKFTISAVFGTLLSWVAVGIISFYFSSPPRVILLALFTTSGLSALLSSVGLLFGVSFAQFDWDHPKRMLSSGGGFLLSIALFVSTGILGGITALIYFLGNSFEMTPGIIDAGAVIINLIIIIASINFLILMSAKRLEKLEWKF
ncbi:hypothetical protein B6I21_05880 [candidate division KSB1 bacterium 4572_119]|nr:MAG: hypothetical protein B6I21_05880 [candidate division KSB1 bacterium 4572_119]